MKKKSINLGLAFVSAMLLMSCDALPMMPNQPSNVGTVGSGGYQQDYFGGSYTNQYDANRSGVFNLSLSQNGRGISGTATYESGNGESSGMLSVVGNVDGNVANLSFVDQRGNTIANGVLSRNENQFSFIQNSNSNWVPKEALMARGR